MFKTILVPTDGSLLSAKAINAAIEFASGNGSKVIGFTVVEPYPISYLAEGSVVIDPDAYDKEMQALAEARVKNIADAAKARGVTVETEIAVSTSPGEEIVKAAEKFHCDVIFMASHGRKGLNKLFVGSETQKVLASTNLPVLVIR